MEIDIEEDENEPELTYPYEEVDPLNPPPPASESEPDDEIEVENLIKHEDDIVPSSVHEVGELSAAPFLREDSDILLPGLMRRDINSLLGRMASISRRLCGRETVHALVEKKGKAKDKFYGKLILELGKEVCFSVEQGMAAMEKLVEKLGNTKYKVGCKKLNKELEEARVSKTFLCMQNERVERDLYWTRVRAQEFYQEMLHKGFVFEERLNEAINVPIEDDSIDDAIAAEQARQANVRNDASGSGPARGQDAAPIVRECTFAGFMKCNHAVFRGVEGAVELRRWFEKTKSVFEISECAEGKKVKFAAATLEGQALTWWKSKVATMGLDTVNQMPWIEMKQLMNVEFCLIEEVQRIKHELWNLKVKEYDVVGYTQRFNELALMCTRMVEPKRVKVDAYIRGLTDNIKGEVTSSKPADLNEAVRMAHKLMEKKSKARDARILEGKKRKISKSKEMRELWLPLPLMESFLCVNDVLLAMLASVRSSVTSVERLGIRQGIKQGHTRNSCPKKVKQEEVREVRGRAYAIKDTEPQGLNVIIGMFLLNNHYAFVLFDSSSDRSLVDTRFSVMLDIDPIKIGASYEVELADGRVASTNTVLKGCTLNLVNHIFEIDLMPIELGMFNVIISMDWLVKHDAVIVCGEKVVRIPYGNEMLIVESDKGVSRLKVILCIKARKYVERGCHLFFTHVTESKLKEKRMEDVPVTHDFLEVFPKEFPGLPPLRQVEFRIDLVQGLHLLHVHCIDWHRLR
uniref:Retrotransposon gag domain-containing protein n=1 Tax=Tanacetum cinerariifolium TaxID=118510 RepID=A0A6L2M0U9_TANCI|nr:hypothetical protein [Tanacetum cinerariifolium]GEW21122.1 hypothetical protein [Tanacetum cinerariifolium]